MSRLAVLAVLLLAFGARAGVEFPNAGSVGLEPPPGMVVSARFAGFEDPERGASILIAELPVEAFAQLDAGFTPQALALKGIVAGEREKRAVAGATNAFLIRAIQSVQGTDFDKWMLVIGAPGLTAIVTVQVPQEVDAYPDEAIDAALGSVEVRAPGSLDEQVASLPFRVRERAGFRVVRVLVGSALLLTDGPQDVFRSDEQTAVIVASGLDALTPALNARAAFARRALATIEGLAGVEETGAESFAAGGSDWIRLEANAVDADTDARLYVVQTIRFVPDGWIRVVAMSAVAQRDAVRERIVRLSQSVASKK